MLPSEVDVPYPAWPIPEASPARVAAMATLAGLRPAPPTGCRVLELGCASGGNLLPLACSHPASQFVGIDLDAREIAEASGIAGELRLDNVRLMSMSVEDVLTALASERFDYVVAHGLYSWVPARAREAIMQVCGALLSERGVAYVSYNTLPGFELREVVRDVLGYHCREATSAKRAVVEARSLLATLLASPLAGSSPLVKRELLASSKANDARLIYDDLGETYAFYFDDVVEHASRHGLSFLGEAAPTSAHVRSFGGSAGRRLAELADDRLAQEALLDVLMLRRFRRSLFCRTSAMPATRAVRSELDSLHALSSFDRPEPSAIAQTWTVPGMAGSSVVVESAHTRAALWCLGANYPSSLALPELRSQAAQLAKRHAPAATPLTVNAFNAALHALFESRVVELLGEPVVCGKAAPRPAAFGCASLATRRGRPVPNLHHRQVMLDAETTRLLGLLDGKRDLPELARAMGLADDGQNRIAGLLQHLEAQALLVVNDE